jgi:hypothetical protein
MPPPGLVCNALVAIGLGSLGSVEMFNPVLAATGLYKGLSQDVIGATLGGAPDEQVQSSQFARHVVEVLGGVHIGLGVILLLSAYMPPAARVNVSIGCCVAVMLHIATLCVDGHPKLYPS